MKKIIFWFSLLLCCSLNANKKTYPPNPPLFYYHIAEASYRHEQVQEYLDAAFGRRRVVVMDQAAVGNHALWKFFLLVDRDHELPMVSFQGTANLRCWGANLKRFFKAPKDLYEAIGQKIDQWQVFLEQMGYGPIVDFVGHSRGGDFVHHVKTDLSVFRITFNGYDCDGGSEGSEEYTLNLRIEGDLFSQKPMSKKANYLTIKSDLWRKNRLKGIIKDTHLLRNFAMASAVLPKLINKEWVMNPYPVESLDWEDLLEYKKDD